MLPPASGGPWRADRDDTGAWAGVSLAEHARQSSMDAGLLPAAWANQSGQQCALMWAMYVTGVHCCSAPQLGLSLHAPANGQYLCCSGSQVTVLQQQSLLLWRRRHTLATGGTRVAARCSAAKEWLAARSQYLICSAPPSQSNSNICTPAGRFLRHLQLALHRRTKPAGCRNATPRLRPYMPSGPLPS